MLQLFETFCAVAETGSLTKAAEALHVAQPTVTRQIKALEQELGAVLLTRTAQGVALTPVGQQVLLHARQALGAVAACRRVAAESTAGAAGPLRLAAGAMLMQFTLPPVLAEFRAEHPGLEVELHTGHYQDCLAHLINYEVDLALIATPNIPAGLKSSPLFKDPVVLALAPGSPLTGRPHLDLADLQGATLLVLPRQAGFRQQVARVVADSGLECHLVEHPTVEAVKTMVGLSMGAALLPRSAVADEVARGRLAAVLVRDWPDNGRTVLAVTRSEGQVPPVIGELIARLKERFR